MGYKYSPDGILRMERKRNLIRTGFMVTRPSNAWRVYCTAIPIPQWARDNAVKDFSAGDQYAWMKHRRKAQELCRLDASAGGAGELLKVEMRRCKMCGRVFLGEEALERRRQSELLRNADSISCGKECTIKQHLKISQQEGWS